MYTSLLLEILEANEEILFFTDPGADIRLHTIIMFTNILNLNSISAPDRSRPHITYSIIHID